MSIDLASKGEGRIHYVVLALLLLHLTLISIQVEDPSGTLLLRSWALTLGAPVLNGSAAVSRTIGNLWDGYVWLHGARAENARLEDRVRSLTLRNSSLEQSQLEIERLRRLLAFQQELPYRILGARVSARAPSFLAGTMYLDRGTADGVRVDLPVVSDLGVIGRTTLVSSSGCQVQLITNADASVGVMIERTRTPGVVRGTENTLLDLNYIANTEDVEPDDAVVTSGLDGIFPKGIMVGKVVESQKGKTGFRTILVEPSADMIRIEEVLILLGEGKAAPAAVPEPGR